MSAVPCGCNEFRWRRLVTRRHLLKGGAGLAALGLHLPASRFAALAQEATPGGAGERAVLVQGQHPSPVINGSYVSPLVEIYGDVEIGQRSFIARNTLLYAAEGVRIHLGHENNVTVRSGATVAGDFVLREGTTVPERAVITNQDEADALPIR